MILGLRSPEPWLRRRPDSQRPYGPISAIAVLAATLLPAWYFRLTADEYPTWMTALLVFGSVIGGIGFALYVRGRPRTAGIAFIVAAVASPNFFAEALNLLLLLFGGYLLFKGWRQSDPR